MTRPPLRVGVLHDFQRADGGESFAWALRLGIDEVGERGRLPAAIALDHEPAHGGDEAVTRGFAHLVERGALAIVGPALTDGALTVRPLADAVGVPCLNYAGNDQARSDYLFHFQIGSLEDEPPLLVGDLMRRGLERVALIYDSSAVGRRMRTFFADAAAAAGCKVVAWAEVEGDGSDTATAIAAARETAPEAVVVLGFWRAAHAAASALRAQWWQVPALANSALMYGHADADWARDWEGWTYVDTYDEANPCFAALARRATADGRPFGPGEAGAYDMGRLLAEGIARAPELTHAGLRVGLERVKGLASATGRAGTVMGFGNWDRGALKGPYLVLREWRRGRSVLHEARGA